MLVEGSTDELSLVRVLQTEKVRSGNSAAADINQFGGVTQR